MLLDNIQYHVGNKIAESIRKHGSKPLLTIVLNREAYYLLIRRGGQSTICGCRYWVDNKQVLLFRVVER